MPSASVHFSLTTTPARSRLIFAPGMPRLVLGSLTVPCSDAVLVGRCPGMRGTCPINRLVHAIRTRNATEDARALAPNDALARLMFIPELSLELSPRTSPELKSLRSEEHTSE